MCYGRYVATSATGWYVATRAMAPTAHEHYDDDQQDQDKGNDPEHFHPEWDAWGQFAARPHAGVTV